MTYMVEMHHCRHFLTFHNEKVKKKEKNSQDYLILIFFKRSVREIPQRFCNRG